MSDLLPDTGPPWLDPGDIAARRLNETEWLVIRPMLFSYRLAVMTADNASVEHWCFSSLKDAVFAWAMYPDVPSGWTRHFHRDHSVTYPS